MLDGQGALWDISIESNGPFFGCLIFMFTLSGACTENVTSPNSQIVQDLLGCQESSTLGHKFENFESILCLFTLCVYFIRGLFYGKLLLCNH